jgi:hypothetical protein
MWIFDPPSASVAKLPQWREYVAMLERAAVEDEDPEEAKAELEYARPVLTRLEEEAKAQA